MAYTMDTKLGDVLNDPRAKGVLDKYAPGVANNPMLGMARDMSLKQILTMPQVQQLGLNQQKIQSFLDEVNKTEQGK